MSTKVSTLIATVLAACGFGLAILIPSGATAAGTTTTTTCSSGTYSQTCTETVSPNGKTITLDLGGEIIPNIPISSQITVAPDGTVALVTKHGKARIRRAFRSAIPQGDATANTAVILPGNQTATRVVYTLPPGVSLVKGAIAANAFAVQPVSPKTAGPAVGTAAKPQLAVKLVGISRSRNSFTLVLPTAQKDFAITFDLDALRYSAKEIRSLAHRKLKTILVGYKVVGSKTHRFSFKFTPLS